MRLISQSRNDISTLGALQIVLTPPMGLFDLRGAHFHCKKVSVEKIFSLMGFFPSPPDHSPSNTNLKVRETLLRIVNFRETGIVNVH